MVRPFEKSKAEVRASWDDKARDWHVQVGDRGDANRVYNSDPVLRRFLGAVAGKRVLDAGCGTGYLARQLGAEGAQVVGVDFSPAMIEVARELGVPQGARIEYRVDSCETLDTVEDASLEKLVSNYVLQDLRELPAAVRAFHRVLRPDGIAVLVLSHPCFPQSDETDLRPDGSVTYRWRMSYFEEHEVEDPPWKHFTSPFTWYHRPLSAYWRAFRDAGFEVKDFDEPVVSDPPPEGYERTKLPRSRMRPNSAAFLLRKAAA